MSFPVVTAVSQAESVDSSLTIQFGQTDHLTRLYWNIHGRIVQLTVHGDRWGPGQCCG